MERKNLEIKITFILGLQEIVLNEIKRTLGLIILKKEDDCLYLSFFKKYQDILHLKSISRAFVVARDQKYNPAYINKHKSIIGELIQLAMDVDEKKFSSFKITCAGSSSPEVQNISRYVQTEYNLTEDDDADLKIHIVKLHNSNIWKVGVQLTERPLSSREYKVRNMSGAMDPTIAYALNSLCELECKESYLNIFSGSGTLLIEAGLTFPNLSKLIGFDISKEYISLSMQNIKKSGLIKRIQIYEKDIYDNPDFGSFDCITSDLPFGMAISKNEDLEELYRCFITYAEKKLKSNGVLAVYTSQWEMLENLLLQSKFIIKKTLQLKLITNANTFLPLKIFICKLK
jgi:tRNA1(Val) A37 N6-methylase TrmN6